MDGTSSYVNLKTGPGGAGLPPGNSPGDIMQWNGSEWVPRQPVGILNDVRKFLAVNQETVSEIIIPSGYKLISFTFAASAGSLNVAQLSAGVVGMGFNVFQARAIDVRNVQYNPEGLTTIEVNQVFSLLHDTTVLIGVNQDVGDAWNGIEFDLYIVLKALK